MLNVDISSRSFEQLLVFVTPKDRGDCQLHLSFFARLVKPRQ